jgi:hypothetical protein
MAGGFPLSDLIKGLGKSGIGGAASTAASATPWGMIAGAAASAIPSIFGAIRGIGQRRQARRIRANAVDPGYEMNSGVMQNADILQNRYNNYTLPGYSMQMDNIGNNAANAFNSGLQGATSGGDVLDLATKIAYGTGQQQNQLVLQNAQGKDAALENVKMQMRTNDNNIRRN